MKRHIGIRTKFAYSLGSIGEGLFSRGYEAFAFFYFVQVLGMPASYGGLAMLISTILDAVTDPLVGSISDRWRSAQGRRHPFLYASAVPLALTWFLLLSPPAGFTPIGLFWWFLAFSIAVRTSLTLYHVPHLALGGELTHDYDDRTSVVQWRVVVGLIGSFGVSTLFTRFFFPATPEYPQGLLNPDGYDLVAWAGAIFMFVSIAYSAWGTRDQIPYLPQTSPTAPPFSARQLFEECEVAFRNPSFRALFVGAFLYVIAFSINEIFNRWLYIYFWGLSSAQIAYVGLGLLAGFFLGVPFTRPMHRRFDKKATAIVNSLVPTLMSGGFVGLKLLGLLPESQTFIFVMIAIGCVVLGACAAVATVTLQSMMADVAQEIAHVTGRNTVGLLFAGTSFSQKFSSGLGHYLAAVAFDMIRIPPRAAPGSLTPEMLQWLGVSSLVATVFSVAAALCYLGYRIDRQRHSELSVPVAGPLETSVVVPPVAGAVSAGSGTL